MMTNLQLEQILEEEHDKAMKGLYQSKPKPKSKLRRFIKRRLRKIFR